MSVVYSNTLFTSAFIKGAKIIGKNKAYYIATRTTFSQSDCAVSSSSSMSVISFLNIYISEG